MCTCMRTSIGIMGTLHKEKSNIDDDSGETEKTMKSKVAGSCHYNTYKRLRPRYQSCPFDITSLTEVCPHLNIFIMKASHHTLSVPITSQSHALPTAPPKAN